MANKYDNNNIFAKILRGEIPATTVYEDDHSLAFMDIMPQTDGHTLVIPKVAACTLFDLDGDQLKHLMLTIQKVATAVKQAIGSDGCTIFQHNGAAAGQTVHHIHFHIVPCALTALRGHSSEMGDKDKIEAIANKIKQFIN